MHGIGNDFVIIDGREYSYSESQEKALAKAMCNRVFGIGSDGLLIYKPGIKTKHRMVMYNPDGSLSEMCGNGLRCLAKFLKVNEIEREDSYNIETGAGFLKINHISDQVQINMGKAFLTRSEIGMTNPNSEYVINQDFITSDYQRLGTVVSMGNPHLVIHVPNVKEVDLETEGFAFEHHPDFPERTNVHFVQVVNPNHIIQRTWERGAGATLACGTGACASLVASNLNHLTGKKARVDLPGGTLEIEYLESGEVLMTGPAEFVFEGDYPTE